VKRIVLLSAAVALLLAGCGSSEDSGEESSAGDEAWSYTSGDGKTYEAKSTPKRIIAQGDSAAALMAFGIKPIAIYSDTPIEESKSLRDLDLSGIEILGETWGQIDAEKAASLNPDLIVATYWPLEKSYSGFEEGVEDGSKKVADLAPVVGPEQGDSVQTKLEGFEVLADSLGADTDDAKVAKDKKDFEDAVERFKSTVAAKKGLTALAVSPSEDMIYVAAPAEASELNDFKNWGLDIIVPDAPNPDFAYWEYLSWENADKYQPDFLLMDDRNPDAAKVTDAQPTWKSIKAAEEGALVDWPAFWIHTYAAYAEQLNALSDAIETIDPDLT
jgi:iron complex transport system substrate-binding protein